MAGALRPVICTGLVVLLLSSFAESALAGRATDDDVRRKFKGLVFLNLSAEREMRRCTDDCSPKITGAENWALIGAATMKKVPASSIAGNRAKASASQGFLRYYLAESAFRNGSYNNYVAHLKQGIAQLNAAAVRLGLDRWFNAELAINDCVSWRLALRVPRIADGDPGRVVRSCRRASSSLHDSSGTRPPCGRCSGSSA
jgi:hypothetical protein